ncbi:glycoside hydrolase family 18 [Cordyceps militaris]|uniref:chitinase n=1 Tax=Cordyceps militaris TaxID=73501 RepID=A0A2H4SD81_CORMI|nr:glycoside hydrolase family 18 [Cordyceps militaris]
MYLVKAAEAIGGDFSCSPDQPCPNGACCGFSGWCGYGPKYCGDGCQSHCDAQADCGEYAADPTSACPLNVCCSKYGFCGTTSDVCGSGCQSHCDQPKPSSSPTNVQKRVIGYWEAWNYQYACGTMSIGEIPVNYLTHLNVAFGYIDSNFRITNMDGLSSDIYKDIGQVKIRNPGLKIMIALGGWAFSDPGPWQSVFPTMVSSQANRAAFIQNLLGFLSEYGYDGVDFDWEYPGADDRGGSKEDGVNYTALLKELREAIKVSGRDYLVTFTAPTSYWYLRNFDIKNMSEQVDWINLMSYDLHRVWDSCNPLSNHVLSHTNLTEIDLALDLFWRVKVDPAAIVLGIGFYGRSFELSDPSCWKPGCRFSGPGAAGRCTNTPGILSYREIKEILQTTGATSSLDKEAAVRYMVYNNNNWISYDDAHTIKAKIEFANKLGLSGVMTWALDLDDGGLELLKALSAPNNKRGTRPIYLYSKRVSICPDADGEKIGLLAPYQYPGFPNDHKKPWEGILSGKYDSISRYWGNSSSVCSVWSVRGLAKADTTWVNNAGVVKQVRASYATEHVYEGQLIGDFFTQWLDNGQVRNQNPAPKNPKQKVPCSWTRQWVKKDDPSYPWNILTAGAKGRKTVSFAHSLLSELGSNTHLDRLTIMLSRPNEKKGRLFTGIRTVDYSKYTQMSPDEQLQTAKDLGIVFNYLNSQTVWDAFCGTYEAIWRQMGHFDVWYAQNARGGPTIPSLQKEWKEYNQVALSSVVRSARAQFDFFYQNRR